MSLTRLHRKKNQNQNKPVQQKLTIYDELTNEDWVRFFEGEIDRGGAKFDFDAKIKTVQKLSKNTPWIHNRYLAIDKIKDCCTQAHTYFNDEMGFIYSTCHSCWKVVVNLQNVKHLMQMYELQKDLLRQAKCGIELRAYVPKLYGAYFYADTLEECKELYKEVRQMVHDKISPKIKIILKRGCTEFEMKYGPSDKWEIHPKQKAMEDKFYNEMYKEEIGPPLELPPGLQAHIRRKWLHWASDHTDLTVLEYTGGVLLPQGIYNKEYIKPYLFIQNQFVTYHEDLDK